MGTPSRIRRKLLSAAEKGEEALQQFLRFSNGLACEMGTATARGEFVERALLFLKCEHILQDRGTQPDRSC